jgi:hypothetical protein
VRDIKAKAAACHASQGGAAMTRGVRGVIGRLFGGYNDTYMQAYPEPGEGIRKDLFGE